MLNISDIVDLPATLDSPSRVGNILQASQGGADVPLMDDDGFHPTIIITIQLT